MNGSLILVLIDDLVWPVNIWIEKELLLDSMVNILKNERI